MDGSAELSAVRQPGLLRCSHEVELRWLQMEFFPKDEETMEKAVLSCILGVMLVFISGSCSLCHVAVAR